MPDRCSRCALPARFPGIGFDDEGVCNYCAYHDFSRDRAGELKTRLAEGFEASLQQAKTIERGPQVLVCYSGGKDSTFLVHLLRRKYGLRVLAFTMDNGFISPKAFVNIRKVVDALDVDHVLVRPRPAMMRRVFREAISNPELFAKALAPYGSACCLGCLGMVLGIALEMGREKGIPLVAIGFTPGQIADVGIESFEKTGSALFFAREVSRDDPFDFPKMIRDPLVELLGPQADDYLLSSQYLDADEEDYPRVLYPYHALVEYDERTILDTIAQYGWVAPKDTDACSTNCRINSVGIEAHVAHHGYHPYIAEMSQLVREGRLTREVAIAREKVLASPAVVAQVRADLERQ